MKKQHTEETGRLAPVHDIGKHKDSDRQKTTPVAVSESPAEVPLENFRSLVVDTIRESPTNPRKTFDEGKLAELAGSIRQYGVQIPLKVRPLNVGENVGGDPMHVYELIAGARRL